MSEPISVRLSNCLARWGLEQFPPFSDVPSKHDLGRLQRLFTGRAHDLDRVILPLLHGRNVLIRGMWGIGKTTFILHTLYELNRQAKLTGRRLLPLYVDNFRGGTTDDFYKIVVFTLASVLADKDDEARVLLEKMRGANIARQRTTGVKGKIGFNLFTIVTGDVEVEREIGSVSGIELDDPQYSADILLNRAARRFGQLVIAIDDLDKGRPDAVRAVRAMLEGALPLLRDERCSFILTGRSLTVAEDIYSQMLGLFTESRQLSPMTPDELREIGIKTLNLVRKRKEQSVYPFTDEAIETIAKRSYGVPRQFNLICTKILYAAVELGLYELDGSALASCFTHARVDVSENVSAEIRRILSLAEKHGGLSQDNRKALSDLGYDDFFELLPLLDYLEQRDLMVRQGERWVVSVLGTTQG